MNTNLAAFLAFFSLFGPTASLFGQSPPPGADQRPTKIWSRTGPIGLQIHPGQQLLIRFKDIRVRELQ